MEKNSNALVSVIIPCFNVEQYVDNLMTNMKLQTYKNWELIIVDDGSTDNTYEKLKEYAKSDSRIKVYIRNRAPKGSVTCRNIGQSKMNGKYFIHFDSDDIIAPFCLEQRVLYMENNPEIDYATFKGKSVIKKDNTNNYVETGRKWGIEPSQESILCFLSAKYPFSVWNNIYRANVFKNYFWDEHVYIYTDFSYIVPALINKFKHSYVYNCDYDYFYIVGQKNAMTSDFVDENKYKSTKYLFDKTFEEIKQNERGELYVKTFQSFFNLQFQRVIMTGSKEQLMDFYDYYRRYYNKRLLRVNVCFKIFNHNYYFNNKVLLKKQALFILLCFFSPKSMVIMIKNRIFTK